MKNLKKAMDVRLQDFASERSELRFLKIQDEREQEKHRYLIKDEILDMADKFDSMHQIIGRQQEVLDAIVKGLD